MCAYAKSITSNRDGVSLSEIAKASGIGEKELKAVIEALEDYGLLVKKGRKVYPACGWGEFSPDVMDLAKRFDFYFPNPEELTREFDEAYSRVSDDTGYAQLRAIRLEMGLSQEVFYRALRKHVEERYFLIAGGEEGFVRKGVVYGIVKAKG
ncbi:MAG: hypothetical protein ACP5HQ_01340 [Thermoprotei archaeon]